MSQPSLRSDQDADNPASVATTPPPEDGLLSRLVSRRFLLDAENGGSPASRRRRVAVLALAVAFGMWQLAVVLASTHGGPGRDAMVYYQAALDYPVHQDPYLATHGMPYIYPPATQPVVGLLARLSAEQFDDFLTGLQAVCAILTLLVMWALVPHRFGPAVLSVLLVGGLGGSLTIAIATGNASVVDSLLVLFAMLMVINRHTIPACLCILAASTFKVPDIVYLVIPALSDRRSVKLCIATGGVFVVYTLVQAALYPVRFHEFLSVASDQAANSFTTNPSALVWLRFVASLVMPHRTAAANSAAWCVYALYAVAMIAAARKAVPELRCDIRRLCLYLLLTTVLLLPRLKDYQAYVVLPSVVCAALCYAPSDLAAIALLVMAFSTLFTGQAFVTGFLAFMMWTAAVTRRTRGYDKTAS